MKVMVDMGTIAISDWIDPRSVKRVIYSSFIRLREVLKRIEGLIEFEEEEEEEELFGYLYVVLNLETLGSNLSVWNNICSNSWDYNVYNMFLVNVLICCTYRIVSNDYYSFTEN